MKKERKCVVTPEKSWKELLPGGLIIDAGNAEDFKTGDWRVIKPVWHQEKCIHCLRCWTFCPDSAILVEDGKMKGFDYEHCKGCGICAHECPVKDKAITMELE